MVNEPYEDLLIDPEVGDNVFNLGRMTPFCHYVPAQLDKPITATPPKKQRTLDPKAEAKRIASPKMYESSPAKATRHSAMYIYYDFAGRMLVASWCGRKK